MYEYTYDMNRQHISHGCHFCAEFRNLSVTKYVMIQADINLCWKNIDQTFAVLFVEVAFVLVAVLQMLFVCICVFANVFALQQKA